jgi:hypothetical protein
MLILFFSAVWCCGHSSKQMAVMCTIKRSINCIDLESVTEVMDYQCEADKQIKLLKKKIDKTQRQFVQSSDQCVREQHGMKICDMEVKLLSLLAFSMLVQNFKGRNDESVVVDMARKLGIKPTVSLPAAISKPKKPKRSPYHVYISSEGVRILVGRSAADNDELSTNRSHRRDDDWWLHISNFAGAHVVICSTDDNLLETHPQTIVEASLLAASNSACKIKTCKVDLTRCRHVKKNRKDPDGLVMIDRIVKTIHVDLMASHDQLCSVIETKNNSL